MDDAAKWVEAHGSRPPKKQGVQCIIMHATDPEYVLMSTRKGSHEAGVWQNPGGKVEQQDGEIVLSNDENDEDAKQWLGNYKTTEESNKKRDFKDYPIPPRSVLVAASYREILEEVGLAQEQLVDLNGANNKPLPRFYDPFYEQGKNFDCTFLIFRATPKVRIGGMDLDDLKTKISPKEEKKSSAWEWKPRSEIQKLCEDKKVFQPIRNLVRDFKDAATPKAKGTNIEKWYNGESDFDVPSAPTTTPKAAGAKGSGCSCGH